MGSCLVNTAVSCQLYSSTKLILICFHFFFCFWKKKYVHPDLVTHECVYATKNPISDEVNGNLKSAILTVENRGGH
jgi:hypothetical protein